MLCTLVLNGLVQGMRGMPFTPGTDFNVVTVSFDPRETPELAAAKKKTYVASYGRPGAAEGWHFLTGQPEAIEKLTAPWVFAMSTMPSRTSTFTPAAS